MLLQFVVVVPLLAATVPQQPAVWLSERADPQLWRDVRARFHEELQPDDPVKTAPYVAMKYKHVASIARASDVYLVVIRERIEANYLPDLDYFVVFSYDVVSHKKTRITKGGFYLWRFVRWADFAPATPEAVFEHANCTECEPTFLLSSFFLDAASRTWTIRNWADDGESITIGWAPTSGADPESETDCLYGVDDFTGDRHADIAVWCRTVFDPPSRKAEEWVNLYTVAGGQATKRTPDVNQARTLQQLLCKGQASHSLCRRRP